MTLDEVLQRARSMLGRRTVYWAGYGGEQWDEDPQRVLASQTVWPGRVWPTLTPAERNRYAPLAVEASIDVTGPHVPARVCDCSGYICWVLKMNRKGPRAAWTTANGSIFTGSIWDDARNGQALFQNLQGPAKAGSLLVYPKPPDGSEPYGHIGLVTEVDAAHRATRVLHCSAANFKRPPHDAILETDAAVFDDHEETLTVWCRDVTL